MRQSTSQRLLNTPRRAARGFTLIDSLIAMAILAFGLLAMTRLQARALAQSTESQARMTVSISWTNKESGSSNQLTATTDVRQ